MANGPASSSIWIRSGYNSSRSSKPGASGIGPRMVAQADSRLSPEMGFCNHVTAPAENVAFRARSAIRVGATNTIRLSPPCSRISKAARWPSREGMSSESTTSSGSRRMYSSTAWSPSSHTSTLKFRVLNRLERRNEDIGLLSTISTVGAASSSISVTKPMPINPTQGAMTHQTTATLPRFQPQLTSLQPGRLGVERRFRESLRSEPVLLHADDGVEVLE